MSRVQILAAAAVVLSVVLIAEGASFLHAPSDATPAPVVVPSPAFVPFDEPASRKGDRLPVLAVPVVSTQSEAAPAVQAPPQQLQAATEDDLRQAEEEHHRHRDICQHGRTYFMRKGHQYWRCRL